MIIKTERDGDEIELNYIEVILSDDTKFKISVNNENHLEINKVDFNDGNISVSPQYANQITVR